MAFPVAMFGVILSGAVRVNVNPLYSPAELAHQLLDAQADTVIVFAGAVPALAEAMKTAPARASSAARANRSAARLLGFKRVGPELQERLAPGLNALDDNVA